MEHNPTADVHELMRAASNVAQGRNPDGPSREQERAEQRAREAQERADNIASAERVLSARSQELDAMRAASIAAENAERLASDGFEALSTSVRETSEALSSARAALSKAEATYGENGTAGNWTKVESARTAVNQAELRFNAVKASVETARADYERAKGRRLSAESDARETEVRVQRARDTLAGLKSTRAATEASEAERIGAAERAVQEKQATYERLMRESTAELAPVLSEAFFAAWLLREVSVRFSMIAAKYRGRFHPLNGENVHTPGDQFVLAALAMFRKVCKVDSERRSIDPLERIPVFKGPSSTVEHRWIDAALAHFIATRGAQTDDALWHALSSMTDASPTTGNPTIDGASNDRPAA